MTAVRRFASALVLCFVASTAPAAAQRDARALFVDGQGEYQAGNYEAAIAAWQQAWALDPRPGLQYNLAQAYGHLGRVHEERAALELFVARATEAGADPQDPQIASARARLVAIAERIRRTGIELVGAPIGARITIDGSSVEHDIASGAPIRVGPGPHDVRVEVEGHAPFQAHVTVDAGNAIVVPVRLARVEPPAPVLVEDDPRQGARIAGFGLLGLAGAGVAVGATLGGWALARSSDVYDGSAGADSARGLALGADVALGVGIAGGAAGLLLVLLTRDSGEEEGPRTAAVPMLRPGGAGLEVIRSF